jgi:hypothetical protein
MRRFKKDMANRRWGEKSLSKISGQGSFQNRIVTGSYSVTSDDPKKRPSITQGDKLFGFDWIYRCRVAVSVGKAFWSERKRVWWYQGVYLPPQQRQCE